MSDIAHIAAIGMLQVQERLQAISVNAASATLPGYRRQVAIARDFAATFARPRGQAVPHPGGDVALSASTRSMTRLVDLRPASATITGRALDVAIDADDLFFALTDGEQTWLTRSGAFQLDASGVMVGESGLRVVGATGDIHLPTADVTIESGGQILHDGLVVGALQLFGVTDRSAIEPSSGALLRAVEGIFAADPEMVRVRAGSLEASNTDVAREMIDVTALARQYESLSRVLQGYDEALGRAIQKLGEG